LSQGTRAGNDPLSRAPCLRFARGRSGDSRYAGFAPRSPLSLGLIGPVELVPYGQTLVTTTG